MTIDDETFLDSWLVFKESNEGCATSTVKKYRGYLLRLADYLNHDLTQTTYNELESFTGLYLHENGAAPSSRRAVIASIKSFFNWLHLNQIIKLDPAKRLIYPRKASKIPVVMGLHYSEKLLMQPDISTFKGLRDAAILAVLIGTGARLSGVRNLKQSDLIPFINGGIERVAIRLCEKGGKERILPLPVEAAILLRAYLGHEELLLIDRFLEDGDQVLFVNLKNNSTPSFEHRGENRRLSCRAIQKLIEVYSEQAGIPKSQGHAHALRHLVGAELAEDSATAIELMTILGHSKEETTAIYTKLALRKLTSLIDKSNPLSKINTSVTPLVKEFRKKGLL